MSALADPAAGAIAVVAAMRREVAPLIDQLQGRRRLDISGLRGWSGRIARREVVVVVCGVGPQRAAAAAGCLLRARPDLELVVSAGYAGGLAEDLDTGDVVIATAVILDSDSVPCDAGRVAALAAWTGARTAAVVTVARAASTPEAKAALREISGAAVVDMEAFAVGRAASAAGVSFLAIKVVLDGAGETLSLAPADWPRLARAASLGSRQLFDALMHLLGRGPVRPWWRALGLAVRGIFRLGDERRYAFRYFAEAPAVEGLDDLPPGPKILACNHQSWLDVCLVYAAAPCRVHWVAKAELFGPRLLRWFLKNVGAIPLDRARARSLAAYATVLARGGTVVIFPEGTIPGEEDLPRSAVDPETGLLPGRTGAVRLALETGVPLIPVGISGTGLALPPEAAPHLQQFPLPRRGVRLALRFGAPLDLSPRRDGSENVRQATERLMRSIASLVDPEDIARARQYSRPQPDPLAAPSLVP